MEVPPSLHTHILCISKALGTGKICFEANSQLPNLEGKALTLALTTHKHNTDKPQVLLALPLHIKRDPALQNSSRATQP